MQLRGQEQQIAEEPPQQQLQQSQRTESSESRAGSTAGAEEAQHDGALAEQEHHQKREQHAKEQEEHRVAEERAALEKRELERHTDLTPVIKAVAELDDFPEAARCMLLAGLPHAFEADAEGDGKAAAHGMQVNFVRLVARALEDARARAAEEAGGAAEAAEQELHICERELAEKAEVAKAAKAEVEARAAASVEASKRAREAESERRQAERAGEAAAQAWQQLRRERERVAAVAEGPLRLLAGGGWEDEDDKAVAMKAVQEHMEQSSIDKALAEAAPLALQVPPAKRARFDSLTVDAITAAVGSGLTALYEKIAKIAPEEAQARAELLGLWAIADVARERVEEAERAESDAQAAFIVADAGCSRAEEKLGEQKETISSFASQKTVFDAKADEMKRAATAVMRLQLAH